MSVDSVNDAINRTLRNTIHREIGCFTDEINKADRIYFLTDIESKKFDNFFEAIKAKPFNETDTDISEKDLLIIFDSEENENSRFYDIVRSFKHSGGHIAVIVANRDLDYLQFVDEILGININQSDIDEYGVSSIFMGTMGTLLDEVDKKIIYFDKK
ncbi:hypothetical protein GCM10025886_25080 [Tetragenococcus halophilus subsp. flandriensis]|uniref:hypothetical protein n=1 Tax=Tetragenococcus halophilus TaxID=51669 RepID=UPI0023E9BFB9|nr:hypothetical protein [Tetragenococcus halophilus]GMA09355.1 hypothetical protein GCM10025886_25080 [Tetragenococcus halophilus subsp. flandriensis]